MDKKANWLDFPLLVVQLMDQVPLLKEVKQTRKFAIIAPSSTLPPTSQHSSN